MLFSGLYRHYSFEYLFFKENSVESIKALILFAEQLVFLLAFIAFLFPIKKNLHLIIFTLLFFLDFYFNNFIKFESAMIGTHLFPLFAYLFLRFPKSQKKIAKIATLIISIGFISACILKINSGWYKPNNYVIFAYLVQFSKGFSINGLLSPLLLEVKSPIFWKVLDYSVLLFQGSFILNFFTDRFRVIIFAFAVLFHMGIMLTLNIALFFPYILVYTLIISVSLPRGLQSKTYKISTNLILVAIIMIVSFLMYQVNFIYNFLNSLPLYRYGDSLITIFCALFFFTTLVNVYKRKAVSLSK